MSTAFASPARPRLVVHLTEWSAPLSGPKPTLCGHPLTRQTETTGTIDDVTCPDCRAQLASHVS